MPRQHLALLHQRLEGQRLPWESATSRVKSRTAGGNTRQNASAPVARDEQKTTQVCISFLFWATVHVQNVGVETNPSACHDFDKYWACSDVPTAMLMSCAGSWPWVTITVGLSNLLAGLPLLSHCCDPHISRGLVFIQDFLKFCSLGQVMVLLFYKQATVSLFHKVKHAEW